MATSGGVFWEDLAADAADAQFARRYELESVRIATIDALVNQLDEARQAAGMSKAALAREVGSDPTVVRRLLSAPGVNPTLGTVAQLAAVLGLRLRLEPTDESGPLTRPVVA
ncbi:MAG: helix-turn-helix domain-containing protein [Micrococcales bacterium]|nr:helix-turn-helix domain-containing protein [Micrococcales bacterium]